MENKRKCFKCGCSPIDDGVKLFRFPKPGVMNLIRCSLWAKYVFPDKEYTSFAFQAKLHSEHRMLCQRHFKDEDFTDSLKTKLLRTAVPFEDESVVRVYSSGAESQRKPLCEKSNLLNIESLNQHQQRQEIRPVAGPSSAPYQFEKVNCPPVPVTEPSDQLSDKSSLLARVQLVPGPSPSQQSRETKLLEKCRKYMQRVCQLKNRLKKMKKNEVLNAISDDIAVKKLSQKITPAFALLLQGQIRNFKKKVCGRRWSKEEKITALRIYKRSPTCYRLLRRLFPLPATTTLTTLLRKLPFGVGVNKPVFNVLQKFTETQEQSDNYYILMFDEMSIKKHLQYNPCDDVIEGYQDHGQQGRSPTVAAYALVFMIAGIRKRIKQPIAHYFSSGFSTADRLSVIIKEVLYQCLHAGVNVAAIVCDMDGVNRRALSILGATIEHPYIMFSGREIVTLYDTPHLLKCFRNLFMKYDIEVTTNISSDGRVGKGVAKWSHIKDFSEVDSANPNFVFAPGLKKEHLDPNTKQKMKVNLAAQVLSHTVAAGMLARVSNGSICAEAAVTANLVAEMDKLFDLMNADCNDLRRGKPHSTNWSTKSPHKEFLLKMKMFFETAKFIGSPRRPPSQDGWIFTINAFLRLRRNLEKENITRLATRRLQQDPIENLFGCIRGNCGSNSNPTCGQFVAGLKTAILGNLSKIGTKGNCETDSNKIINNFNLFLSVSQPPHTSSTDTLKIVDSPQLNEHTLSDDSEIQACAYVCGFIVKRIKNSCATCHKIFVSENIEPQHIFTQFREYEDKKSLLYVTKPFIACVENCATLINSLLKQNGHMFNLKAKIIENIKSIVKFNFLDECTEHKYKNIEDITESVFLICVKRFCILENRKFSEEASAVALKRKIKIITHK